MRLHLVVVMVRSVDFDRMNMTEVADYLGLVVEEKHSKIAAPNEGLMASEHIGEKLTVVLEEMVIRFVVIRRDLLTHSIALFVIIDQIDEPGLMHRSSLVIVDCFALLRPFSKGPPLSPK